MRVEVADIRPGDTIVLSVPHVMTKAQAESIKANAEAMFPGHKVIVLTDGVALGLLRSAA